MRFTQVALFAAGAAALEPTRTVEARDMAQCASVAMSYQSLLTSVPTAPADVMALFTQSATITNGCEIPAVTGDKASGYSSWMSELSSWQDEHKTEINSVMSACSDELNGLLSSAGFADMPAFNTQCSKYTWASATGGSKDAKATDSSKDSNKKSDDKGNAAARQGVTGLAVVAVAGAVAASLF